MGVGVGPQVGVKVGCVVGLRVGAAVGDLVGLVDGAAVGIVVGALLHTLQFVHVAFGQEGEAVLQVYQEVPDASYATT